MQKKDYPRLRECPFCGKKPIIDKQFPTNPYPVMYSVQCNNINCPVNPMTNYCKDKKFIIESWNRRVTDANA